jgi:hypothetical protein
MRKKTSSVVSASVRVVNDTGHQNNVVRRDIDTPQNNTHTLNGKSLKLYSFKVLHCVIVDPQDLGSCHL